MGRSNPTGNGKATAMPFMKRRYPSVRNDRNYSDSQWQLVSSFVVDGSIVHQSRIGNDRRSTTLVVFRPDVFFDRNVERTDCVPQAPTGNAQNSRSLYLI